MATTFAPLSWGRWSLTWGQSTHVMGIINITPDSFGGDGMLRGKPTREMLLARVLARACEFVEQGATLIDVGGESTRPGFTPLSPQEEIQRVIPVIEHLARHLPPEIIISVDTYKAEVARRALEAGAALVNDIWGLQRDPEIAAVVADGGVPVVLMANMRETERREIVSDVLRFLGHSIDLALAAGVDWERIIVDPGIGFGTTPAENLTLLRRLGELRVLGRPILLGTSRKSTLGLILGNLPPSERVEATAATVALGIAQGADIVRVHDVGAMVRVARMSDAIVRGTFPQSTTR